MSDLEAPSFDDVFAREPKVDPAEPADTGPLRDEQGRFAPREATPPPVETKPVDPAPKTEQPPAPDVEELRDGDGGQRIPLAELKAERQKRQAAERQFEELSRQVNELMQRAQQPQHQAPQPQNAQPQQQMPDPWTDPQGAFEYQQRQTHHMMAHLNANMSEGIARQKFGDEAVNAAQQAALQAGLGEQFLMRRDPYGDLMRWHRQASFLSKVGSDPDAYEKSIEQKAYERALADLRAGKAPPTAASGAPAPAQSAQRFPGSLASATATGTQGAVLTDEAVAASIFDSNRNRRQ